MDSACWTYHLYWSISQNTRGVLVYKLTHRTLLQHCVKHTSVLLPDKECWLCHQQRATVAASNTFMKRRSPVRYHTVNGFKQSLHAPAVKYLLNNFTQKYLLKKHSKLLDTRPGYCVQNQRHVVHYKTFVQVHKNFKRWVFKPTAWQHILPGKANNPLTNQGISRLAVNRETCRDAKAELIQNTKCYQSVLMSRACLWWLYGAFKL